MKSINYNPCDDDNEPDPSPAAQEEDGEENGEDIMDDDEDEFWCSCCPWLRSSLASSTV